MYTDGPFMKLYLQHNIPDSRKSVNSSRWASQMPRIPKHYERPKINFDEVYDNTPFMKLHLQHNIPNSRKSVSMSRWASQPQILFQNAYSDVGPILPKGEIHRNISPEYTLDKKAISRIGQNAESIPFERTKQRNYRSRELTPKIKNVTKKSLKEAAEKISTTSAPVQAAAKTAQKNGSHFGKIATGVGVLVAGVALINSMNNNKGQQTPAQLYGQQPQY